MEQADHVYDHVIKPIAKRPALPPGRHLRQAMYSVRRRPPRPSKHLDGRTASELLDGRTGSWQSVRRPTDSPTD